MNDVFPLIARAANEARKQDAVPVAIWFVNAPEALQFLVDRYAHLPATIDANEPPWEPERIFSIPIKRWPPEGSVWREHVPPFAAESGVWLEMPDGNHRKIV